MYILLGFGIYDIIRFSVDNLALYQHLLSRDTLPARGLTDTLLPS